MKAAIGHVISALAITVLLPVASCTKAKRTIDCQQQVDAFAGYLRDAFDDSRSQSRSRALVSTKKISMPREQMRWFDEIEIGLGMMRVSDNPIDDTSETLVADIAERLRRGGEIDSWGSSWVYVAVDADAPWSSVVATSQAAPLVGIDELRFVVAARSRAHEPPRSKYHKELASRPDLQLALERLKRPSMSERLFANCPGFSKVYDGLSHLSTNDKEDKLAVRIPAMIAACNCRVDFTATYEWAYFFRDPSKTTVATESVRLGMASAPLISLPAGTRWGVAYPKVAAAGGRARFAVTD